MTDLIMKYDVTKLGHISPSNETMSLKSFREQLRAELTQYDVSAKQLLWDGDPAKEGKFDSQGDYKSSYLI